jgi:hypothetical protein
MFWLRFASSTKESGHTAFISSSLETTSRLWRTRMRSVFEGLRSDGNRLIFAQQDLSVGIDLKGAELVEHFESCSHA